MSKPNSRRLSVLFVAVAIAVLALAGFQLPALANGPGISGVTLRLFTCSSFQYWAAATPGGYAAVRIWVSQANQGVPLVDSYTAGYPASYTAIDSSSGTTSLATVNFTAQTAGTTLVARVYRAPNATTASWDSQHYVDTTISCNQPGINHVTLMEMTCSSLFLYGQGWPGSGYAAVRIWSNGVPIVDSYTAGHPSIYELLGGDGSFSINSLFPPQPAGSSLELRIYRALSAVPGSWDDSNYYDTTGTCRGGITPTPGG